MLHWLVRAWAKCSGSSGNWICRWGGSNWICMLKNTNSAMQTLHQYRFVLISGFGLGSQLGWLRQGVWLTHLVHSGYSSWMNSNRVQTYTTFRLTAQIFTTHLMHTCMDVGIQSCAYCRFCSVLLFKCWMRTKWSHDITLVNHFSWALRFLALYWLQLSWINNQCTAVLELMAAH